MLKSFRSLLICSLFVLLTSFLLTATDKSITVGILDSTQQQILGNMLGIYLEDKGLQISYEVDLSSLTLHRTMAEGRVDIAWEDPAVIWFLILFEVDILPDEELYERVRELDKERGLLWLGRSNLEKRYVLVMKRERAEELGVETISDLAAYVRENPREIRVAMEDEFFIRPDCYANLKEAYGLSFPRSDITTTVPGIGFGLLASGEVDVVVTLSTDPLIIELDLVKLEDDQEALTPHRIGIVAREEIVNEFPSLPELVDDLIRESPSTSEMVQLNLRVHNGEPPEEVAREYLKEKELIDTGGE